MRGAHGGKADITVIVDAGVARLVVRPPPRTREASLERQLHAAHSRSAGQVSLARRTTREAMRLLLLALSLAAALAIPVDPVMSYVDEERMSVGPQTNMAEQVRRLQRGRPLSHFMVPGLASSRCRRRRSSMPAGRTIERLPSLERRDPMPKGTAGAARAHGAPHARRRGGGRRRGARRAARGAEHARARGATSSRWDRGARAAAV